MQHSEAWLQKENTGWGNGWRGKIICHACVWSPGLKQSLVCWHLSIIHTDSKLGSRNRSLLSYTVANKTLSRTGGQWLTPEVVLWPLHMCAIAHRCPRIRPPHLLALSCSVSPPFFLLSFSHKFFFLFKESINYWLTWTSSGGLEPQKCGRSFWLLSTCYSLGPEDLNAMVATGPMSAKTLSAWRWVKNIKHALWC